MAKVEYIENEPWNETIDMYGLTSVVKVDDLILISGTQGDGDLADPEEQFTSAFQDVADMLAAAGSSWDDVVKMTTYHQGGLRKHMDLVIKVKDRFVKKPYPAWTGIGVAELTNPNALIEVDVIAVSGGQPPPKPSTHG